MASSSSQHRCVFVGNIPYDATEEQLVQICEEVGPVVSFRLVLDRETGKPKGYGFCEYKDEETALSARRNLQGYDINGRHLRVDFAENDKGTDRNREQGRGGPGLAPNTDGQKASNVTPLPGSNSNIHQPIGLPSAANAASIMARALGGVQTSNLPGFQNQSGFGNDSLSHHLAKMSKTHLLEVMFAMKAMAQDNASVRQLLQSHPQFTKALFQAQIMLGLVPQQMLQIRYSHQSGSLATQSLSHSEGHMITLPQTAKQPPFQNVGTYTPPQDSHVSVLPQNLMITQQTTTQARFQPPQEIQPHVLQRGTLVKSGVQTTQIHPSSLSNSFQTTALPSKKNTVSVPNVGQRPAKNGSSSYHLNLNGCEEVSSAKHCYDSVQGSRTTMLPNSITKSSGQMGRVTDPMELENHPSKLARLHNDSRAPQIITSSSYATTSAPAQGFNSRQESTGLASNTDVQHPEKQALQCLPGTETALLQQVMSLTSEQLNSLPPEQRQQVIQLQLMLRSEHS